MGRRATGSAAQSWIDVRRGCLGLEGPSMLEGVVEETGSEGSPDVLAIRTFPHSLRVWPGSGNKQ